MSISMLRPSGSHCCQQTDQDVESDRSIQTVAADRLVPPPRPNTTPLKDGCADNWSWDNWAKSHEVLFLDRQHMVAQFHANWSNGTAAVRGNKTLNYGVHYWEVSVSQRVFGTSMMFGVCTKHARLHANAFLNLLGEDDQSWGLSHKGLLWHDGKWKQFSRPFRENQPTTIGMLFNWYRGTLSYYKDGELLGVAFHGLNIQEDLFPVVASTAAKTEMTLGVRLRSFDSLQDRCRSVIAQYCRNNGIDQLPLPNKIRTYIKEVLYGSQPLEAF